MRLLITAMIWAVVWSAGCATSSDAPAPDLSPWNQEADERLASLDASEASIDQDVTRLEQLRTDLNGLGARAGNFDLPLSLLRMVAMNCLNAGFERGARDVVDIEGMPLTCQPAHLHRLQEALEQQPTTARDTAYEILYVVDQARLLRGSLRRRLASLPQTVNDHYEFIADQRAMLRQIRADLQQQRNVYSASDWREVHDRIDDHFQRLEALESRIEQLASDFPQWPQRVDQTTTAIYFALTDLRGQQAVSD